MTEVLKLLLDGGLVPGVCFALVVIGKIVTAIIISKNDSMSDEKAKYITEMMSHDININLRQ